MAIELDISGGCSRTPAPARLHLVDAPLAVAALRSSAGSGTLTNVASGDMHTSIRSTILFQLKAERFARSYDSRTQEFKRSSMYLTASSAVGPLFLLVKASRPAVSWTTCWKRLTISSIVDHRRLAGADDAFGLTAVHRGGSFGYFAHALGEQHPALWAAAPDRALHDARRANYVGRFAPMDGPNCDNRAVVDRGFARDHRRPTPPASSHYLGHRSIGSVFGGRSLHRPDLRETCKRATRHLREAV